MKEYRGTLKQPGKDSPYRTRSVEENLALFEAMRNGEVRPAPLPVSPKTGLPRPARALRIAREWKPPLAAQVDEGVHIVRAKIDMGSPNINMRDPAIYRVRKVAHQLTGDKWCIYPMWEPAPPPPCVPPSTRSDTQWGPNQVQMPFENRHLRGGSGEGEGRLTFGFTPHQRWCDSPPLQVRLCALHLGRDRGHHALALHPGIRGPPPALRLGPRRAPGLGAHFRAPAPDGVLAAEPTVHGAVEAQAHPARRGEARSWLGRPAHADHRRDPAARGHARGAAALLRARWHLQGASLPPLLHKRQRTTLSCSCDCSQQRRVPFPRPTTTSTCRSSRTARARYSRMTRCARLRFSTPSSSPSPTGRRARSALPSPCSRGLHRVFLRGGRE